MNVFRSTRRTRTVRPRYLAVAAAVAVMVGGCGSGSGSDQATDPVDAVTPNATAPSTRTPTDCADGSRVPKMVEPVDGITVDGEGPARTIAVAAGTPLPEQPVMWVLEGGSGEMVADADVVQTSIHMVDWSNQVLQATPEDQKAAIGCGNAPSAVEAAVRSQKVGSSLVVLIRNQDVDTFPAPNDSPAYAMVVTIASVG